MKFYLKHKNEKFNAIFESSICKIENEYGNGIYLSITRNGEKFLYLDCRYAINFNEELYATNAIKNYYGKNIESLEKIA